MTIHHGGEVATIGETRDVLAAIATAGRDLSITVSALADQLYALELDDGTLATIAEIRDGSDAVSTAADRALHGLNRRHAGIEEAVNIPANRPVNPVSFANLERDQRIEAMRSEIDAAMERLADPEGWRRFLDAAANFHKYTVSNVLLALAQNPDARLLAGFKDWQKKHGRTVRKGEKAIWIYAPIMQTITATDPETGEEKKIRQVKGFRPVPVFDVAQTDGEPIPARPDVEVVPLDGAAPPGVIDRLSDQIAAYGFSVEYETLKSADGYTDFDGKRVVISESMVGSQRALVLGHELAHIALGHAEHRADYHTGPSGRRPEMEIEAESVAYVLARHHGIPEPGQASFGYIAGWARGDKNKVRATADRVLTAIRALLAQEGKTPAAYPLSRAGATGAFTKQDTP